MEGMCIGPYHQFIKLNRTKGIAVDENENKPSQRGGAQLGNMDSILRTNGSFIISYNGPNASHIALQVSRNLFQYYGADSEIVDKMAPPSGHYGNLISICSGSSVPKPQVDNFPLQISGGTIRIRDHDGNERAYEQDEAGSAIFVRPFGAGRLELVIWGADAERTFLAARLMPTLTGVGQPDFIVLSDNCKWKGVDGAVALGFFGHKWNVTRSSYLS